MESIWAKMRELLFRRLQLFSVSKIHPQSDDYRNVLLFYLKKITVLYLTSSTSAVAKAHNHKTLMPENVLTALDEIDFENFVGPLRETLDKYRTIVKSKKAEIKSSNNNETEPNEEVPAETEN